MKSLCIEQTFDPLQKLSWLFNSRNLKFCHYYIITFYTYNVTDTVTDTDYEKLAILPLRRGYIA